MTVDYATSDGTAHAGTDYTATAGTLTFGAGETSQTITIPILNNTVRDRCDDDQPDPQQSHGRRQSRGFLNQPGQLG